MARSTKKKAAGAKRARQYRGSALERLNLERKARQYGKSKPRHRRRGKYSRRAPEERQRGRKYGRSGARRHGKYSRLFRGTPAAQGAQVADLQTAYNEAKRLYHDTGRRLHAAKGGEEV